MSRKPWNKNVVRIERIDNVHFRLFLECGHHINQRWHNIGGDEVIADPSFEPSATIRTCPECKAIHTGPNPTMNCPEGEPIGPPKEEAGTTKPTSESTEAVSQPLVPVTHSNIVITVVPPQLSDDIPGIWQMTDEEFVAWADGHSPEMVEQRFDEAWAELTNYVNRGAHYYFTVGRWINWMRNNSKHGQWGKFLAARHISKARASKLRKFARENTPESIKGFEAETFTFNLERALGYEAADSEEVSGGEAEAATSEEHTQETVNDEAATSAEDEGDQDEPAEATPPRGTIPFPGGTTTAPERVSPTLKPKATSSPKPKNRSLRLPKTARFQKIERVGTELLHALWADGKKSYGLLLSIEQAAPLTCGLSTSPR